MHRDEYEYDDDDREGRPMRTPIEHRSPLALAQQQQPTSPPSLLTQLRERGLIKPDEREHDQLQRMFNRAMDNAVKGYQRNHGNGHERDPHDDGDDHAQIRAGLGRTIVDRNGLLAHERCAAERDAREQRHRAAPVEVGDDRDEGGGGIGWAGALALLGLGWLIASFASEGK